MADKQQAKPFVEAGMRAFQQQHAVDELLKQIISDATGKGEPNLAAQIGMFVVYMQQLEQTLKRMIGLAYGFKSYFNNNGYSVMTKTDAITKQNDPLGRLVETLKNIHIRDEATKSDILTDFCNKLSVFVQKRNDYIHRLVNNEQIQDIKSFKLAVMKANQELLELISEADAKMAVMYKVYELDGLPYTFARHVISSEKYEPKPRSLEKQ